MHYFSVRYLYILLLSFGLQSCCWFNDCGDTPEPDEEIAEFNNQPVITPLNVNFLNEVSGIVPSLRFTGHLWLMEDSGNEPKIDLINTNGQYVRKVAFGGINRDWEDIAIGPGPENGKNYIYIGEIGDNQAVYDDYYIYRFEEPQENQDAINTFETIHFRYPNGERYDAETLILEPKSKDLYVITKAQANVRVYKLPYPQSTTSMSTAEFMGTIKFSGLVSGDISLSGEEILIKSYLSIFYWKIKPGENVYQTLSRTYDRVCPYYLEPQGESICWSTDARGYFTLSEKGNISQSPPLYYYSKKQ